MTPKFLGQSSEVFNTWDNAHVVLNLCGQVGQLKFHGPTLLASICHNMGHGPGFVVLERKVLGQRMFIPVT